MLAGAQSESPRAHGQLLMLTQHDFWMLIITSDHTSIVEQVSELSAGLSESLGSRVILSPRQVCRVAQSGPHIRSISCWACSS